MERFKDTPVSFQDNFWGKIITRTLYDVLIEIKENKYKTITEQLRSHYIKKDGLYGVKKRRLPVVTFCANFNDEARTKENIKNYNSIMIIDIDDVGLKNIDNAFHKLSSDIYLFALWKSPSGNGIKGLIKLNFEKKVIPAEIDIWHYSAFAKISSYFSEQYQIELDQSGKDFTRLCFVSHDENILIKSEISSFLIKSDDKLELRQSKVGIKRNGKSIINKKELKNVLNNPLNRNSPSNKKDIQKIIKFLSNNKKSITYNYDDWLRVALAIASSFTFDLGLNYFLELSKMDSAKFDSDSCSNMLQDCYINNKKLVKFSTLIHLAVQKGFLYGKDISLESN